MKVFRPQNQIGRDLVALDDNQKINNVYLHIDSKIKEDSNNAVSSKAVSAHTNDTDIHTTANEKALIKKTGDDLYGKIITLDQVGNYGTTTDVITGIVVENPSSHGLKSFSALIFPNVQNDSVENIGEVTATCNITHAEKGIISINSAPITSWKRGEEIRFTFNEVIEVDDLVKNVQILLNLTNEDNAPVIFYDANSNSTTWFSTKVPTSVSPDHRPWFGKSRYKLIEVSFLSSTGLIQTIYDNQQQCHTDVDSLNSRIDSIDIEQERSPFDVYEGDGGEDTICGFELKSNLYNNTPTKFNTVTFTEPLNTVDDVLLYAHIYYNNRLTATSLPVTHWEANTPLRFYFTNIVEKGAGPIRVLISPSSTDGTHTPSKQHGVRIKHSNSTRPNANVCWYNNNNNSYQWSTTGYSTFKVSFSTSGIQVIKDSIQDIQTKLDTLYPVHTGDRVVDTMKPVSCHTVWNELNDIKAGQNLQMVSYLATHTHGVNTVDGFAKDATHVTTNEKRWINELNEVVRGKYIKLSNAAQYYNTLGSQLAKIPFTRCEISKNETVTDLTSVIPSKFSEIVLHDVQNNSETNSSPVYLVCQVDDSKTYYSSPVSKWKTISDYAGGNRHYIHGEDLHFVFDENIEITSDTSNVVFALVANENDGVDQTIDKSKAPHIKIDPTENTGTLSWFTIYNSQDVISETSLSSVEHKALNMSFVDASNASIKNEIETLSHFVDSAQDDIYALDEAIRNIESEVDSLKPRTKSTHDVKNDNGATEQSTEYRQIILNKKHFDECEGITSISIQLASDTEPTNKNELYLGVGKCQLNGNISEIIAYSKNKARQFQGGTLDFEFDRFTIDADTQYISLCLYEQQHESGFDTTDNLKEFNVKYREVSGDDDSRLIRQENYPDGIVNGLAAITLTCEKEENISDVVASLEGLISEVSDKADNNKKEIEQLTSDYESLSDDVYNFLGDDNDDATLDSIIGRIETLEGYHQEPSDEPNSDVEELKEELEQHTSNNDIHLSKDEIEKIVKELQGDGDDIIIDQEFNGESENAQSGVAIQGELEKYAKLESIENFVTSEELDKQISSIEIPSIDGLATTEYVDNKIGELNIPEVPDNVVTKDMLGEYAKTSDVEEKISKAVEDCVSSDDIANFITEEALEGYAKTEDIPDTSSFITSAALNDYAKKNEIPSIDGLASKEEISSFITAEYLTDYAKTDEVQSYVSEEIKKIEIPDISGLATKDEISGFITNAALEPFAKKTDIPDTSSFITEEALTGYAKSSELAEFVTQSDIDNSISNLATKEEVLEHTSNDEIHIKKTWKDGVDSKISALEAKECVTTETLSSTLGEYSKTEEILKTLSGYVTNEELGNQVDSILEEKDFATNKDVTGLIEDNLKDVVTSESVNGIVESKLGSYVKREELSTEISDFVDVQITERIKSCATKSEFNNHIGDYDTHFATGEKSELYQDIEDLQQTVQSLQSLVQTLQNELQQAKLENISLKTWVEENFIKGEVVTEDTLPEESERKEGHNYFVVPANSEE